jgi:GT2 family glycosyltransferase
MTQHRSPSPPDPPVVAVVIVNWNGYDDSRECLESVFAQNYPNLFAVVCDNASSDGSLHEIAEWARLAACGYPRRREPPIRVPPLGKPINAVYLTPEDFKFASGRAPAQLFLVQLPRNLGFAGAANVGIRCGLSNPAVQYVWLLNNDTLVAPDCLTHMVSRLQEEPAASMCGSRLMFYDQPNRVQALGGGKFYKLIGESRHLGFGQEASRFRSVDVESRLDHLLGASMLVRRSFIEQFGVMDDAYFLYYEEIDWVRRAGSGCKLLYAHDAIVYHKGGSSIGTAYEAAKLSPLAAYFLTSSRLKFVKRYYPVAVPTTIMFCLARAASAYVRGNRPAAIAILAALVGRHDGRALVGQGGGKLTGAGSRSVKFPSQGDE